METFTFEEYKKARITIAAIEAEIWWRQNVEDGPPIQRQHNHEGATLSAVDAAKFIGIGKSKLYELVGAGEIPTGFKVGSRRKWLRADLERYVAKKNKKGIR